MAIAWTHLRVSKFELSKEKSLFRTKREMSRKRKIRFFTRHNCTKNKWKINVMWNHIFIWSGLMHFCESWLLSVKATSREILENRQVASGEMGMGLWADIKRPREETHVSAFIFVGMSTAAMTLWDRARNAFIPIRFYYCLNHDANCDSSFTKKKSKVTISLVIVVEKKYIWYTILVRSIDFWKYIFLDIVLELLIY